MCVSEYLFNWTIYIATHITTVTPGTYRRLKQRKTCNNTIYKNQYPKSSDITCDNEKSYYYGSV